MSFDASTLSSVLIVAAVVVLILRNVAHHRSKAEVGPAAVPSAEPETIEKPAGSTIEETQSGDTYQVRLPHIRRYGPELRYLLAMVAVWALALILVGLIELPIQLHDATTWFTMPVLFLGAWMVIAVVFGYRFLAAAHALLVLRHGTRTLTVGPTALHYATRLWFGTHRSTYELARVRDLTAGTAPAPGMFFFRRVRTRLPPEPMDGLAFAYGEDHVLIPVATRAEARWLAKTVRERIEA